MNKEVKRHPEHFECFREAFGFPVGLRKVVPPRKNSPKGCSFLLC
jgi:hypothetical protein